MVVYSALAGIILNILYTCKIHTYLSAGCDKSRDNSEKFSRGALGQLQCLQKKRTSLRMYM